MIAVRFNKDYAEKVVDALSDGKPIPAPIDGAWNSENMLTLAGILHAAIFSRGPHSFRAVGNDMSSLGNLHGVRREAIIETFNQDICEGVWFVSDLCFKVATAEYEEKLENEVVAFVGLDEGETIIMPVKGFKKYGEPI